jgi:hypothetical protein
MPRKAWDMRGGVKSMDKINPEKAAKQGLDACAD